MNIEPANSFEKFVSIYKLTRRHIQEDSYASICVLLFVTSTAMFLSDSELAAVLYVLLKCAFCMSLINSLPFTFCLSCFQGQQLKQ